MGWNCRYRIRLYIRDSIWVLPSLGMIVALVLSRIIHVLEKELGWQSILSPDATLTVLIALASAMFTFIVFVSSALLLALQLASAQLTPRIIALVFRDPVTKFSLALFVFTFTFLVAAAVRINDSVPLFTAKLAAYSCMTSLVVFCYLIDHVGRLLRPNEALRSVGLQGRRVIESVYPHDLATAPAPLPELDTPFDSEHAVTLPSRADGVVLACDVPGLVAFAEHADCTLALVPQIGDFVAAGSPLFRVFGGNLRLSDRLYRMVAIGHERTMEQDPAFAFRIIVDIASKALSPAINDPTTAVLAIDQLHHLLGSVGRRCLDDDRIRGVMGRVRLIYRTPGWDDFVHLAVTEIRQFGSESIQVARRLRAMLMDLIPTLPEQRARLLRQELAVLQRSAARFFPEPEDRALAAISDSQGVGGRIQEEHAPQAATHESH